MILKVFANPNGSVCAKAHSALGNACGAAQPSHHSASHKIILINTYSDMILSAQTEALTIPGNLNSTFVHAIK